MRELNDAERLEPSSTNIKGYNYELNDSEFNILSDVKKTILRAFNIHKDKTIEFIAVQLGISRKSLDRYLSMFDMKYLTKQNIEYRKSFKK